MFDIVHEVLCFNLYDETEKKKRKNRNADDADGDDDKRKNASSLVAPPLPASTRGAAARPPVV